MAYRSRACLKVIDDVLCHKPPGQDYLPFQDSPLFEESAACQSGFQLRSLDDQRLTEAAVLVISAQASATEPLFKYFTRISGADIPQLRSFAWNRFTENPARWKNKDRLSPFFHFADCYGGIEKLSSDFLEKPDEVRETIVKEVDWVSAKTASFFYYAAGGNSLATIDMHVLEQARSCGLDIAEKYVVPKMRKSGVTRGKLVRDRPPFKDYIRIEEDLKGFWESYNSFERLPDGSLDVARWFTAFWLAGIQEDRYQRNLPIPSFSYPFSDGTSSNASLLPPIQKAEDWFVRQNKILEQLSLF